MRRRCDPRPIDPRSAPRRGRPRLRGAFLSLALAAGCGGAAPAPGTLYVWTDAKGSTHYTANRSAIPRDHRRGARVVASEPPGAPAQGTAIVVEPDPFNRPGSASGTGGAPVDSGPVGIAELDARIREVEASIARDEEALKALIGDESPEAADSLESSPKLREIAGRLPGLQAELRELRAQRAAKAAR
jgi:hypothetical protein